MATMTVICSICKDSILKTQNPDPTPGAPQVLTDNNVNAMVAPCGHAFHYYCITRWMSATPASFTPSCPNCRRSLPRASCKPLYLDTYDLSLDSSLVVTGDDSALRDQIEELNTNVRKAKDEQERFKRQLREIELTNQALSEENSNLNDRLSAERLKSDHYLMRCQESASFKTYAEEKDKELQKAKEELDKLKYVQTIVNGVRFNEEEDTKTFPANAQSIKALIQLKNVLQQEIENAKAKHQNHKIEKEEDRQQILRLRSDIRKLKKDNADLEFQIHSHQRIRITTPSTSTSTAGSPESDASPLPTPGTNGTAANVNSYSEVIDIDEDDGVGLISGIGSRSNTLKRTRSGRMGTITNPTTPKLLKRSASSVNRLTREMNNIEPLSPLNLRFMSSVPGLSLGLRNPPSKKGTSTRPAWKM